MFLFWRLILAHLLADFTLQTNRIAEKKSKDLFGVFIHSFIFLILSLSLSVGFLGKNWIYIVIIALSHFFIDTLRMIGIKKYKQTDNVLFFILDQVFHLSIIFLVWKCCLVFSAPLLRERWVIILSLYIIATHFATIFIYYLKNFDKTNIEGKEKHYGILERTIIFFCLLLPGFWKMLFPLIWLGRVFLSRTQWKEQLDFSRKNLIVGNGIAVIVGIIARLVYIS
ncbi:DUF3307 domain-containing protein [bacterium]|nr:DUF3307 domain-containing protein [bacterium]